MHIRCNTMEIMVKLQGLMCDETDGCRPFCYRGRGISAEYVRFENGRSERERRRAADVCKADLRISALLRQGGICPDEKYGGFVVAPPGCFLIRFPSGDLGNARARVRRLGK